MLLMALHCLHPKILAIETLGGVSGVCGCSIATEVGRYGRGLGLETLNGSISPGGDFGG